jgi:hypothetical protein
MKCDKIEYEPRRGGTIYTEPLLYILPNTGIRIKKWRFISGFVGLTDAALKIRAS